jgi:hypothetical protein
MHMLETPYTKLVWDIFAALELLHEDQAAREKIDKIQQALHEAWDARCNAISDADLFSEDAVEALTAHYGNIRASSTLMKAVLELRKDFDSLLKEIGLA